MALKKGKYGSRNRESHSQQDDDEVQRDCALGKGLLVNLDKEKTRGSNSNQEGAGCPDKTHQSVVVNNQGSDKGTQRYNNCPDANSPKTSLKSLQAWTQQHRFDN